jgi:ABC-2 type transport system permease protein
MELRKILSYRVDFWVQFLGSVVAQFGVAWFLWRAIFDHRQVDRIGVFSFPALMLYYLAAPLVRRMIQGAEMGNMSDEIYEGTLNRYLIYPVSFFRYKLAAHAAHSAVFVLQCILVVALFGVLFGIPGEFTLSPASVLQTVVCVLLATYLYFVIVSTIELTAFWADNVWSLVVIVRFATGLLGGGMVPLSLFPDWAEGLLSLLPFAYFIAFPIRTLFGLVPVAQWWLGLGVLGMWSVLMTGLFCLVWEKGKYQYTGVGI